MLTALKAEQLTWSCLLYDKDGSLLSCGKERTAHLSETRYHAPSLTRGGVIALPRCACGVQMFLKADYSLKEAWQACMPVVNDEGQMWAFVMRPGHARNLVMHWMHHLQGATPLVPALPMPPQETIAQSDMDTDVLYALWFGWQAYQAYGSQHVPRILETGRELWLCRPMPS